MAIRFTCPSGHRLKVPDEKAGRGMLCPVCQEAVNVPEAADADSDGDSSEPPPIEPSGEAIADDQLPEAGAPDTGPRAAVPPLPNRPGVLGPDRGSAARTRSTNSPPWGVAAGLLIVIAYSTLPALGHLRDVPMPTWARAVFGMALLQTVFVVWMLTVRHWAAMVVVTLSFALASTAYAVFAWFAMSMAMVALIPRGTEFRAAVWSATVLAVYLVTTYLCGVAARSWRREAIDEFTG